MTTRTRLLILAAPALSAVLVAQQNAPSVRNPLGGDPAVVAEGQSLFNQVCQSCHGPGGQGSDRGPALTRTTLTHGNADADVFRAIRTGVPGTQMPPFAGFTDTQIWQLVSYIRSLQGPASVGGTDGADDRRHRGRRGVVLWPRRVRDLPRSQRTRRRARSGSVERRTALAGRAAAEDRRPDRAAARRGRPRGWEGRRADGHGRREDAGRARDSRRPPQRGHVLAADDRLVRPAAVARQDEARVRHCRYRVAPSIGLRDKAVGFRHHEPRRISPCAAGTRPDQDCRRAAASGRRHVRAAPATPQRSLTTG